MAVRGMHVTRMIQTEIASHNVGVSGKSMSNPYSEIAETKKIPHDAHLRGFNENGTPVAFERTACRCDPCDASITNVTCDSGGRQSQNLSPVSASLLRATVNQITTLQSSKIWVCSLDGIAPPTAPAARDKTGAVGWWRRRSRVGWRCCRCRRLWSRRSTTRRRCRDWRRVGVGWSCRERSSN